ncbi:MAG TPA: cytochrome c [Aliidongia sp.]|uniref:c-type cytochrome n=1 Tax=Aliidongia sp. TaxID=1914230 RepID=UPI002DDCE7F1|nr:cytochrome c [Aliidongia sp.]HEV2676606.1 cytochrome c [Aliidongia sp.]
MPEPSVRMFAWVAMSCLSLGAALAETSGGAAIVADRQATMQGFAKKVRLIKSFADGEDNGPAALEAAQAIFDTAQRLPTLFPEGTSLVDLPGVKTHAKPEIWGDNEGFRATAARLAGQSQALVAAIQRSDRSGTATELGAVGRVGCGACHEKFRAPLD